MSPLIAHTSSFIKKKKEKKIISIKMMASQYGAILFFILYLKKISSSLSCNTFFAVTFNIIYQLIFLTKLEWYYYLLLFLISSKRTWFFCLFLSITMDYCDSTLVLKATVKVKTGYTKRLTICYLWSGNEISTK